MLALGSSFLLLHAKGQAPQLAVYERDVDSLEAHALHGQDRPGSGSALAHSWQQRAPPARLGWRPAGFESEKVSCGSLAVQPGIRPPLGTCDPLWVLSLRSRLLARSWPCCGTGPVEPGYVYLKPPHFPTC